MKDIHENVMWTPMWVSEYKRGMDMVFVSKLESIHWKENPTEISPWEVSRDILKTLCAIKDTVKINPCRKKFLYSISGFELW